LGYKQPLGLVKIVAQKPHGKLIGVHILGPFATELIAQAAMALRLEALVEAAQDAMRQL